MRLPHMISKTSDPQLRIALLGQYVANHKANLFGIPLLCIVIGSIFAQWTNIHLIFYWAAVLLISTGFSGFIYLKFEKEASADPARVNQWAFALAIPRTISLPGFRCYSGHGTRQCLIRSLSLCSSSRSVWL